MTTLDLNGYKIEFWVGGGFAGPTYYMLVNGIYHELTSEDNERVAHTAASKILSEIYNITELLPKTIKWKWGMTL